MPNTRAIAVETSVNITQYAVIRMEGAVTEAGALAKALAGGGGTEPSGVFYSLVTNAYGRPRESKRIVTA